MGKRHICVFQHKVITPKGTLHPRAECLWGTTESLQHCIWCSVATPCRGL